MKLKSVQGYHCSYTKGKDEDIEDEDDELSETGEEEQEPQEPKKKQGLKECPRFVCLNWTEYVASLTVLS